MFHKFLFLFFFSPLFSLPILQHTLMQLEDTRTVHYNPFATDSFSAPVTLHYGMSKKELLGEWKLSLSTPEGQGKLLLRNPNGELAASLLSRSSEPLLLDGFGTKNLFDLLLPNKSKLTFSLQCMIPSGTIVSPGLYSGELLLELFDPLGRCQSRESVRFLVTVGRHSEVCITQGGEVPFRGNCQNTLDFGLVTGEVTRTLQLGLRTNCYSELNILSLHRGFLVSDLLYGRGASYPKIPYSFWLDGSKMDLRKMVTCGEAILPSAKPEGMQLPMKFTLHADPSKHWQGVYEDELTIILEALE